LPTGPWLRLTSAATAYYAARVYLTNRRVRPATGEIPGQMLSLMIGRCDLRRPDGGHGLHIDAHNR
jgi:hypothetical protein